MARKMSRTTVMADDLLLDQLRAIARNDGVSLGEVIRQGLELRVNATRRPPSFIGAVTSPGGPHDVARRVKEILYGEKP